MGKPKKPVMIDVDGVLANFCQGFSAATKRCLGLDIPNTGALQPAWDYGLTQAQHRGVWSLIEEDDWAFWSSLAPLEAPQTFLRLNQLHRPVYYVTARRTAHAHAATVWWLQAHGICCPAVIMCARKAQVAAALTVEYAIDDKLENVIELLGVKGCRAYVRDWLYNRNDGGQLAKVRVSEVATFLDAVEGR